MSKLGRVLVEEVSAWNTRLQLARLILAPLPLYMGSRLRVQVLRAMGFRGIDPSVVMWGLPTITGPGDVASRLQVGPVCRFSFGCVLNLGGQITIGRYVGIGPQVMIMTETHPIASSSYRSGNRTAKPVVIGDGSWIGARATILPGVTIGSGAVVAAGSVVTKDVMSNTLVGGVPARKLADLGDE